MTYPEIARMVCYVIGAPAFALLAFDGFRQHTYWYALRDLAVSLLFSWYMIELTMIGKGINTRDYRIIGTPMIIVVTLVGIVLASRVIVGYYVIYKRSKEQNV